MKKIFKKYGKRLEIQIHKPGTMEFDYSAAIYNRKGRKIETILAGYWRDIILFAKRHKFKILKKDITL